MIALERVELASVVSRPEALGQKTSQFQRVQQGRPVYRIEWDPAAQVVLVSTDKSEHRVMIPAAQVRAMFVVEDKPAAKAKS